MKGLVFTARFGAVNKRLIDGAGVFIWGLVFTAR